VGAVPVARAHDLVAPTWRGDRGTSFYEWQFSDDANPAEPEVVVARYGQALATVTLGQLSAGWLFQLDGLGTQEGYWDLGGQGGQIDVRIESAPWPLDVKEVWVQVTYFEDISQSPAVEIDVAEAEKTDESVHLVEAVLTGGAWKLYQTSWVIDPYASQEEVQIIANPAVGSLVDQIFVDVKVSPACHDPFADIDADGDVDQQDFAEWQKCFTGEDVQEIQPLCGCFDRDNGGVGDGDIDGDDLVAFEACSSAPEVPADPACDD
jgi:hypothetical protein